jgi:hypothetical protein
LRVAAPITMQRHVPSGLWLHDDAELAAVLKSPIVRRTTIHQWPMSCVQRLECASGPTRIYKVQAPPTIEPTFYERARSPLVVGAQTLPLPDGPAALLLEDVRAPRLCDRPVSAERAVAVVDDLLDRIRQIAGDLPAYDDIRTAAGWEACSQRILANLRVLGEAGHPDYPAAVVDEVQRRCNSAEVRDVLAAPMGYVHDDLLATNVLVVADGYRVVDWQRPILGPVDLDRATLLESLGVDPATRVPPGVLLMRSVLRVGFHAVYALRRAVGTP